MGREGRCGGKVGRERCEEGEWGGRGRCGEGRRDGVVYT